MPVFERGGESVLPCVLLFPAGAEFLLLEEC